MPLAPEWTQHIVEERQRLAASRARCEDEVRAIDRTVVSLEVEIRAAHAEFAEVRERARKLEDLLLLKSGRQAELIKSLRGYKDLVQQHHLAERELEFGLLPIQDFPAEILALIFTQVVEDQDSMKWVLASVCRLWRNIALTTPQLWCLCTAELTALTESTLSSLRTQLSRTGMYPLEMKLNFRRRKTVAGDAGDDFESDDWQPMHDVSESLADLRPSIRRWKVLTMRLDQGPKTGEVFSLLSNDIARHSLDKLETLTLASRTSNEWLMSENQIKGIVGIHKAAPRLWAYVVRNVRLPVATVPSLMSDSLRLLVLEDVTIALSLFTAMLNSLPALEELTFTYARQKVRMFHDVLHEDTLPVVRMTNLKLLKCHAHPTLASYIKQLLSFLHCPALEDFSFASVNNVAYMDHIKMRDEDSLFFLRAPFLKILNLDHICLSSEANTRSFLESMPNLEDLSSSGWQPDQFHHFLHDSMDSEILPSLRHVEFHGECSPVDLLPWLEARCADQGFHFSSCLERLLWSQEDRNRLQALAGEGDCTWADHSSEDEMLNLEELWLTA